MDYWEAKAEIEAKFRTVLVLKLDKLEEKKLDTSSRRYVSWVVLEAKHR